jgi:hypothetical protein
MSNLREFCLYADSVGAGSSLLGELGVALITVPPSVDFWNIDSQARSNLPSRWKFARTRRT